MYVYIQIRKMWAAENKEYILDLLTYCKKTRSYVDYYKKQTNP